MRTSRAGWVVIAAAGLGLLTTGCGGSPDEAANSASGVVEAPGPEAMAPPAAPGPGAAGAVIPAAPGGPAGPADPGMAAAAAGPEAVPPAAAASNADSGTDQLLAMANSAVAEPAPAAGAGAGAGGAGQPGAPGLAGEAAAPGMGPAGPAGYPGAAGMPPGPAGIPMMPPDLAGGPQAGMPPGPDGMLGMMPPDPAGGLAGAAGIPGVGGGLGQDKAKEPNYGTPIKAAETFLDALKHKDTRILAESTALRAEREAETAQIREMFAALREESLAQETLDNLARAFKDMKVVGMNKRKSTGSAGVIVGKSENSEYRTRTLTIRHEKDGWKVMDFSNVRVQKMPRGRNNRGNTNSNNDSSNR